MDLSIPFKNGKNVLAELILSVKASLLPEKYDFDGIDIDWEYPGFAEHSGRPKDKENFTLLLKELYEAAKAHQPPLLVTIAAPAGPSHMKNMELEGIHNYLDWINIMTYDFHGPGVVEKIL